jgi:hypothetical protein
MSTEAYKKRKPKKCMVLSSGEWFLQMTFQNLDSIQNYFQTTYLHTYNQPTNKENPLSGGLLKKLTANLLASAKFLHLSHEKLSSEEPSAASNSHEQYECQSED